MRQEDCQQASGVCDGRPKGTVRSFWVVERRGGLLCRRNLVFFLSRSRMVQIGSKRRVKPVVGRLRRRLLRDERGGTGGSKRCHSAEKKQRREEAQTRPGERS